MEDIKEILKWDPIQWTAGQLLQCLQKHREGVLIHFFYQEAAYETGIYQENGKTIFFLNEEQYPSMLAYRSAANIDGILISDLMDQIIVFAINGEDPALFVV